MKKQTFYICFCCIFIFGGCKHKKIEETRQSLENVAGLINDSLYAIHVDILTLTEEISHLYDDTIWKNTLKNVDKSKYFIDKHGVYRRKALENLPTVFVSSYYPLTETVKNIVWATEPVDEELIHIKNAHEEIVQAYYNDSNNYSRLYPPISINVLPANLKTTSFNFYYLADTKHNPEKKAVWINTPYLDPAGRGWMISLIAPVCNQEKLLGVAGLDITVNTVISKYLDAKKEQFILTSEGYVISSNPHIADILYIQYFKSHKYLGSINKDIYLSDEFSLLKSKNKDIRKIAVNIVKRPSQVLKTSINKESYVFVCAKINEINWHIIEIIN